MGEREYPLSLKVSGGLQCDQQEIRKSKEGNDGDQDDYHRPSSPRIKRVDGSGPSHQGYGMTDRG